MTDLEMDLMMARAEIASLKRQVETLKRELERKMREDTEDFTGDDAP